MKALLEALLFARSKGISIQEICTVINLNQQEAEKILNELSKEYESRDSGIRLNKFDDSWKMAVRDDLVEKVRQNIPVEMNKSLMKTLAVIAYKSPVLQSHVVHWRGQNAYNHVKQLLDEEYIIREQSGKSFLLKVTPKFYNYFNVRKKEIVKKDVQQKSI